MEWTPNWKVDRKYWKPTANWKVDRTYCPQIEVGTNCPPMIHVFLQSEMGEVDKILLSTSDSLYFYNGLPIRQAGDMYWQRLSAAKATMQSMQGKVQLKPRQRQSPLNGPQRKLVDNSRCILVDHYNGPHCKLMEAKAKTKAKALVPLPPATPPLPPAPPLPPIANCSTNSSTSTNYLRWLIDKGQVWGQMAGKMID